MNFQRSHSGQNVHWSAVCSWGAIVKRFCGCLSNVMKGQQCHEFTTCAGKNVSTFLFILFVSVIGFSLLPFVKVSKSLSEGNFFYIKKKFKNDFPNLHALFYFGLWGFRTGELPSTKIIKKKWYIKRGMKHASKEGANQERSAQVCKLSF